VEVKLRVFFTSALDGDAWSALRFHSFVPVKGTAYPSCYRRRCSLMYFTVLKYMDI